MRAKKKVGNPDKGKFVVGWSECGELSQLEVGCEDGYDTLAKAQNSVNESIDSGEFNTDCTYYILKVEAVSKKTSVTWE